MAEPAKREKLLGLAGSWVSIGGRRGWLTLFRFSRELRDHLYVKKLHLGAQEAFACCGLVQSLRGLLYLKAVEISRNKQIVTNSLKNRDNTCNTYIVYKKQITLFLLSW